MEWINGSIKIGGWEKKSKGKQAARLNRVTNVVVVLNTDVLLSFAKTLSSFIFNNLEKPDITC
jgi:hypothetical protein